MTPPTSPQKHGLHTGIQKADRRPPQLVMVNSQAPIRSISVYAAPQEEDRWFSWSYSAKIPSVE